MTRTTADDLAGLDPDDTALEQWDRWPGEPAAAHAHFEHYRQMGRDRARQSPRRLACAPLPPPRGRTVSREPFDTEQPWLRPGHRVDTRSVVVPTGPTTLRQGGTVYDLRVCQDEAVRRNSLTALGNPEIWIWTAGHGYRPAHDSDQDTLRS